MNSKKCDVPKAQKLEKETWIMADPFVSGYMAVLKYHKF